MMSAIEAFLMGAGFAAVVFIVVMGIIRLMGSAP